MRKKSINQTTLGKYYYCYFHRTEMKTEQENKVGEILSANFGIKNAEISILEGYESENYKVEAADGRFVLKVYENTLNLKDVLTAENLILQEMSKDKQNCFSNPLKNVNDKFLTESDYKYVRLLSFVEGEFLAEVKHTEKLFYSFGKFLAEMDLKLLNFRDVAIESKRPNWDVRFCYLNKKYLPFIGELTRLPSQR